MDRGRPRSRLDLHVLERQLAAIEERLTAPATPHRHRAPRGPWAVRARIGAIGLFLGVTGITAVVAVGMTSHGLNAGTAAASSRSATAAPGIRADVHAANVALISERAVQQYGVLARVASKRSTPQIAAAADALQASLQPLVAQAPLDPAASDTARQLLTGERTILATSADTSDPVVTTILTQTATLLAQLPVTGPTVTASSDPTTAPTIIDMPTVSVTPSSTPTPTPTPTPALPTPSPTAPPTEKPTPPSPAPTATKTVTVTVTPTVVAAPAAGTG